MPATPGFVDAYEVFDSATEMQSSKSSWMVDSKEGMLMRNILISDKSEVIKQRGEKQNIKFSNKPDCDLLKSYYKVSRQTSRKH